MGRKIAIAVLLAVALLVVLAVALRPEPSPIPADADHLRTLGRDEACMECHGASGRSPRPDSHPPANDCLRCHARPGR